jgi:cellulose biosynthesis protein BcsQ
MNANVIAFGNQKGGVGKSSVLRLVATELWYSAPGVKTCLWDCDNPQYTIAKARENDLMMMKYLPHVAYFRKLKEAYERRLLKGEPYLIREMTEEAILNDHAADLSAHDLVFVDLPGRVDSEELAALLPMINYLFIPTDFDFGTLNSTITYIQVIKNMAERYDLPLKDNIYVFFNRVQKNRIATTILPVQKDLEEAYPFVRFMEAHVLERRNIKDDSLSTLCRLSEDGKTDNLHFRKFFREFTSIIQKQTVYEQ